MIQNRSFSWLKLLIKNGGYINREYGLGGLVIDRETAANPCLAIIFRADSFSDTKQCQAKMNGASPMGKWSKPVDFHPESSKRSLMVVHDLVAGADKLCCMRSGYF